MNNASKIIFASLVAAAVAAGAAEVARFPEYIESDGTGSAAGEYVMLDYKPTAASIVEADVALLDLSFNNTIFCARGAYETYSPFTLTYYTGNGFRWDYNRTTAQYEAASGLTAGERFIIRAAPDGLWIDGVKSDTIVVSQANYTPANKMVLFASYRTSISASPSNMQNAGNWSKMRLYSFKAWDDNGETLKIHLRPCVDTDGVACLYDVVNDRLYYNIKSGKAFTASAANAPDVLFVTGFPAEYASPTPAYGSLSDIASGDQVSVSCPAVWTNDADTVAATCTGWKLYDNEGTVVSSGPENTFTYIHPGVGRRLEWQWAVEYKVSTSTDGGGTVAPAAQWIASGATATVTATPSATHSFSRWTGNVPAGANASATTLPLTVTEPVALKAVFLKTASSGTRAWIGGAAGDWSNAANWDPEGVPAASETVVFAESAAVSPSPTFLGTISVGAGATLSATYASAARFSLAVASGGRFEKRGTGEATIMPADGDYPGTVVVIEGSAAFAGNGLLDAPGVFGPLEVAAGATARVIESPFETRHAVVTFAQFDSRAEGTKTGEFNTYAKLQSKWAEYLADPATCRKSYSTYGVTNSFTCASSPPGSSYLPDEMVANTNKYFAFITKAVFLFPSSKNRRWSYADIDGSAYFYRGTAGTATGYNTSGTLLTRAGWVPFAVGFGGNGAQSTLTGENLITIRLDSNVPAALDNVFSHGSIWKGVCFGGLSLAEGATLRVEEGQAVGFAFTAEPTIAGSVIAGGSGACFSLMLSDAFVDLAPLTSFAGRVEVGVHCRTRFSASSNAAYTIIGDGEIVAEADGLEERLAPGFAGTIRVPAGRTFASTSALGAGVTFKGAGEVVVAPGAPRPTADFPGSVVLAGAQTFDVAKGLATHSNLSLGAGSTLSFDSASVLAQGVRHDLPSFAENGWMLAGTAAADANGSVSLTDGASQTAAVWLPSYPSLRADAWQVKFTYSASETSAGAAQGDGFAFLLRSSWTELPVVRGVTYSGKLRDWICVTSSGDSTCYGFTFRPGSTGTGGFSWVAQGYLGNGRGATSDKLVGFDFLAPIDFTVSYAGDAMNVRLEQNGAVAEFRHVFTQMYTSGNKLPRFLGIAASTDTAAKGTLVQGLSNLSGWYRTEPYADSFMMGDAYTLSPDNWVPFKNAVFTNDNAIQLCSEPTTGGVAIARAPIPLACRFRLACHVVTEELDYSYVRSFFAAMLQNQGLAAGELPPSGGSASGSIQEVYVLPSIANSVAGYFQSYSSYSKSQLGFRTAARSFAGNTTDTMPSGLTQTFDYTLSHDGAGRLTETLSYGSVAYSTSASFTQLSPSAIGDEFYLMLAGYCGIYTEKGVNHCAQEMRVDDLSVIFPLNHDALFDTPLSFAGDATFVVDSVETNAASATATFPSVTLAEGATLTVSAETATRGALAGMGVAHDAPATLATANGATVRLDTVTVSSTSPSTLTLVGDFTLGPDGLTVVIPGGRELRGGFTLLDFADATFAGGIDASRIHFVDEEGRPLDSLVAVVRGDDVRVQFRGGTMIFLR